MNILLIVNSNNVFEIDSGGALRNNLFVRAFSEIGHVDIICFTRNDIISNISNCDVLFSKLLYEDEGLIEAFRSFFCITFCPSNPYSYYQVNKQKEEIVDSYVKKKDYDIIACRYVDSAIKCGLLKYKDKLVIDVDDNPANVLKFFATKAKSRFEKCKKLYESKRIGRMLNFLCNNVRCTFSSNPLELPSSRTVYLHNTTILKQLDSDIIESTYPRILFVGYLNYYPNRQGIAHFVESIFPQIKSAIPLVELRIVGDGKPEFLAYLNGKEGVKAMGRVDDVASEYQQASVVVIPIYYGSGTCVKFVEALFMNRPVVSSLVGARGFCDVCREGEDFMLAKNDEEFVKKTIELLSSESKAIEMSNKGFDKANNYYSQDSFIDIVKKTILESFDRRVN